MGCAAFDNSPSSRRCGRAKMQMVFPLSLVSVVVKSYRIVCMSSQAFSICFFTSRHVTTIDFPGMVPAYTRVTSVSESASLRLVVPRLPIDLYSDAPMVKIKSSTMI